MKIFDGIQTIKSNGKRDLPEIIPQYLYNKWFGKKQKGKIFVLNKGRCGNRGTTGFMQYAKNNKMGLTIIVPNISIVKSKELDTEICSVYGGKEIFNKESNVRICTWDKHAEVLGYSQVGVIFDDFDFKIWDGSLLVIDEYHKLVDDCNFRKICSKVVETIISTNDNVVLMSATPNWEFIEFLEQKSGKKVEVYEVEYDEHIPQVLGWVDKEDKKMFDIVNTIIISSREKNTNVVFFYNSVKKISDIVNQLYDDSDVEVLCSKNHKDKDIPCYSEKYNDKKRIHFATSAYFTGMDILERVNKIVIIGGNGAEELSYSANEIKQMLGRGRDIKEGIVGYDGSFIIRENNIINMWEFGIVSGKMERYKEKLDDENDPKYIDYYLKYLYYSQKKNSMESWENFDKFKEMMSVFSEYTTKKIKIGEPLVKKRKRDISFKKYQRERLKGNKIPYRYSKVCEKFIELYGLEKFGKVSRNLINRLVKLNEKQGDLNIEKASKSELFDAFLGDGYFYGSYLMSVLDYLGVIYDVGELEETIMNTFDCFCVMDGNVSGKRSKNEFLCFRSEKSFFQPKSGTQPIIYIECVPENGGKKPGNNFLEHKLDYKISLKISNPNMRTTAITTPLHNTIFTDMRYYNDSDDKIQTMVRNFYNTLYDNPTLKSGVKSDDSWGKVFDEFKKYQQMISEFYKNTKNKYQHIKSECEKIDTIIIDIDNSISFSKFKEIYQDYKFTAYPSISNIEKDWTKYRVIFYLNQTLNVPNETLKVLKILRLMVCKYEDKKHNLGSYINGCDWYNRYENDGMLINITQDLVVYIDTLIKTLQTYTFKTFTDKDGKIHTYKWDIEKCKEYANEHFVSVGDRHDSCYAILMHIDSSIFGEFDSWLRENHPLVYNIRWIQQVKDLRKNGLIDF